MFILHITQKAADVPFLIAAGSVSMALVTERWWRSW